MDNDPKEEKKVLENKKQNGIATSCKFLNSIESDRVPNEMKSQKISDVQGNEKSPLNAKNGPKEEKKVLENTKQNGIATSYKFSKFL